MAEQRTAFAEVEQEFTVFTHSRKTRVFAITAFMVYVTFFALFSDFLMDSIYELKEVPGMMAGMGEAQIPDWLVYMLSLLAWLVSLSILLYFLWTVIDFWGLHVSVSPKFVVVSNTIVGASGTKWMGLGTLCMQDIVEVKGTPMATFLVSQACTLRISPVERLEVLVSLLQANAVKASFTTGRD